MIKRLLLLFSLVSSSCLAQLANQPPAPVWLHLDAESTVEKRFTQTGPLLKAILLVASDAPVKIRVNGTEAAVVASAETASSVDVTRLIRAEDNALQIQAQDRAARVALLLELNGDLNRKQWLTSDKTWTGEYKPGESIAADSPGNPFDFKKTFDAYNSWQLAKPGAQAQATDASSIEVPAGFKVELIRSAQSGEDSWVSMAFDPSGRITLGKEKKGLLRLTISGSGEQKMEVIDDSLLECRGLLYAHGALFANANNSKALCRLRDVDGDGIMEEKTELLRTEGGVGHGRNHIKLGPDGNIYIAHGNNVLLAKNVSPDSPLKNYADDQLLPNPWDATMFDGNVELPAGHVLKVAPDGSKVELIAGGLRNPLDIAFNKAGALFTFDADMERDVGTHFYMPTRVLHIVPGADYGWRRGTGRWPAWYVDTLPSVVDVGLSSPTAIFFGYGTAFPKRYQDALFICDWSYGRLIAVHMNESGASYRGSMETFATGRPLNLTDGAIGPDGALWFITGGRGTQSGLYRISYTRPRDETKDTEPAEVVPDRFALHAKRMALEQRLPDEVPTSLSDWETATVLSAFARAGSDEQRERVISAALKVGTDDVEMQLAALRVIEIAVARGRSLTEGQAAIHGQRLLTALLSTDARLRREACKHLVYLESPDLIDFATRILTTSTTSEDLTFYPFMLRYIKDGWTTTQRRTLFEALNKAEKLNGASTYFKIITDTRSELAAALTPAQAQELADVIHPAKPAALLPTALPGHSFKQWTLADLEPQLPKVLKGRSFNSAKSALISSQCVFCHKVSNDPALPAGLIGPDLVRVRSRFSTRDLLMHVLEPSLVIDEKFRAVILTKTDGQQVAGTLESEDDERIVLKPNPLAKDVIETAKAQVKDRKISEVSTMPKGLLNPLKAEQILDLLAWFEVSGDPNGKVWK